MQRNPPGVHFIDALDKERNRSLENDVAFGNSSASSIITPTPMATPVLPSSVTQSAPTTTSVISIAAPRTEVKEPQILSLRPPLTNVVPDMTVIRRPKMEDCSSADPPMASSSGASSLAGQSLTDFMDKFDSYKPTIPDSVVQHYMHSAGLSTSDPKVCQLIALASQKFISDIVNDAYHFSQTQKCKKPTDKKSILTLDVLKPVLEEYGINVKKPSYMQ